MNKKECIEFIIKNKIIAIIRSDISENLDKVVEALNISGIRVVEISLNTPDALPWIEKLAYKFSNELLIGAGTVIDNKTAVNVIKAGAKCIVSPISKLKIIKTCQRYNVVSIPGALTPNEALVAHEAGADFIKLFPAGNLGPEYIKAIKSPLPQLSIIPVGGVKLDNAKEFLDCGADALAIGGNLVSKKAIINKDYKLIEEIGKQFVERIRDYIR